MYTFLRYVQFVQINTHLVSKFEILTYLSFSLSLSLCFFLFCYVHILTYSFKIDINLFACISISPPLLSDSTI